MIKKYSTSQQKILFLILIIHVSNKSATVPKNTILKSRETELLKACKYNNYQAAQDLLKKNNYRAVIDSHGMTPLHYTADRGYYHLTQLLVTKNNKNKKYVNKQDNNGNTPLHLAARAHFPAHTTKMADSYQKIVKLLLEHEADVTVTNNQGFTPLHWAALANQKNIVLILLYQNADPTRKTNKGLTPAQLTTDPAIKKILTTITTEKTKKSIPVKKYLYQLMLANILITAV